MFDFTNSTVLVTGGAGGLGADAAAAFAAHGADVVLSDYDGEAAQATAQRIEGTERVLALQCDVRDENSVADMFAAARDRFGSVDIVFAAAGNVRAAMVHKMETSDFDDVIAVHLRGTYLCLRHAVSEWREKQRGKFIAVTSPAATEGQIGGLNYAAAKAGIIGLVKSAALELARSQININAILPVASTPMTDKVRTDPALSEKFLANIPMRRWAEPGEITPGVLYLASREADYVTGVVLPIDGGRTI